MALSCDPALLIADETTTAIDVTIQAQILKLLQDTKSRFALAIQISSYVSSTAQRLSAHR
jgi:peptide/nickel transport system ATP-binding protein